MVDLAPTMPLPIKNTFISFDEIPSLPMALPRGVTCPPSLEPRGYIGDYEEEHSSRMVDLAPTMPLPIKNTFISFDEIPSLPMALPRGVTCPPSLEPRGYIGDYEEEHSSRMVDLGPTMPLPIKNTFISFDDIPSLPMARTLTCPPCLGPRDYMEDCLTDC